MLIPDFTHQLLQNILQSNNTHSPPEFINNHSNMMIRSLKLLQQLTDFFMPCNKKGRTYHILNSLTRPINFIIKILMIKNTNYIINTILIHRKPGIPRLRKYRSNFLRPGTNIHSNNINSGRKDIRSLQLIKFKSITQQIPLLLINPPILPGLLQKLQHLRDLLSPAVPAHGLQVGDLQRDPQGTGHRQHLPDGIHHPGPLLPHMHRHRHVAAAEGPQGLYQLPGGIEALRGIAQPQ